MKKILIATLLVFSVLTGCKDDTPVDTTGTQGSSDPRDALVGKYKCDYSVFNSVTLNQSKKGTFDLEVYANTEDETKFDFRQDGLILFMTGANLTKVSDGYSFTIPEQDVEDFGNIIGVPIINVPGQTTRVEGHFVSQSRQITVYCERANKGSQDNDLFEFSMTRK